MINRIVVLSYPLKQRGRAVIPLMTMFYVRVATLLGSRPWPPRWSQNSDLWHLVILCHVSDLCNQEIFLSSWSCRGVTIVKSFCRLIEFSTFRILLSLDLKLYMPDYFYILLFYYYQRSISTPFERFLYFCLVLWNICFK